MRKKDAEAGNRRVGCVLDKVLPDAPRARPPRLDRAPPCAAAAPRASLPARHARTSGGSDDGIRGVGACQTAPPAGRRSVRRAPPVYNAPGALPGERDADAPTDPDVDD